MSKQLDLGLLPVEGAERFRAADDTRHDLARDRMLYALDRIVSYWGSDHVAAQCGRSAGSVRSIISGAARHDFRLMRDTPVLLALDTEGYLNGAIQSCLPVREHGDMVIAMSRAAVRMYGDRGQRDLMRTANEELCRMRRSGTK